MAFGMSGREAKQKGVVLHMYNPISGYDDYTLCGKRTRNITQHPKSVTCKQCLARMKGKVPEKRFRIVKGPRPYKRWYFRTEKAALQFAKGLPAGAPSSVSIEVWDKGESRWHWGRYVGRSR